MKYFIVGHSGSGTRLVASFMRELEYDIGNDLNETLDYMPILGDMMRYIQKGEINYGRFRNLLQQGVRGEKWAIKHPQLCLCIPVLKKLFPESQIILCKRDAVETVIRQHPTEKTYKHLINEEYNTIPERRMVVYREMHKKAYRDGVDYTVILEDLVHKTPQAMSDLCKFLNEPYHPEYCNLIKTMKTRKYDDVDTVNNRQVQYTPDMRIKLERILWK